MLQSSSFSMGFNYLGDYDTVSLSHFIVVS